MAAVAGGSIAQSDVSKPTEEVWGTGWPRSARRRFRLPRHCPGSVEGRAPEDGCQ